MAEILETLPRGRQDRDLYIIHSQNHGCWWSGCGKMINSNASSRILPEGSCLRIRTVNGWYHRGSLSATCTSPGLGYNNVSNYWWNMKVSCCSLLTVLSRLLCSQTSWVFLYHDDVIKWKLFPRYWPFVRGIHRLPVTSPHRGQWRGALMFSFIFAWTNGWVNNREAGDLGHHRAYHDLIVMQLASSPNASSWYC